MCVTKPFSLTGVALAFLLGGCSGSSTSSDAGQRVVVPRADAFRRLTILGRSPVRGQVVAAFDADGDGSPDLFYANGQTTSRAGALFLNDGAGKFHEVAFPVVAEDTRAVVVADFNQDGALDLATANHPSFGSGTNYVYFNDGLAGPGFARRATATKLALYQRVEKPDQPLNKVSLHEA